MVKGKSKASGASPKGSSVRKVVPARVRASKAKNPKATGTAAAEKGGGGGGVGGGAGGGSSKKPPKKARPSEAAARASAAAAASASSGAAANTETATDEPASANGGLFKMTCTCPHLVDHPGRVDLLRKLVDVRTEVSDKVERALLLLLVVAVWNVTTNLFLFSLIISHFEMRLLI